eukprot:NODE_441_length_7368_cov_0.136195.p3 type:complete len:174 gc:universal NODE_441_length_7368_cov_0.136195:6689-7210(+)
MTSERNKQSKLLAFYEELFNSLNEPFTRAASQFQERLARLETGKVAADAKVYVMVRDNVNACTALQEKFADEQEVYRQYIRDACTAGFGDSEILVQLLGLGQTNRLYGKAYIEVAQMAKVDLQAINRAVDDWMQKHWFPPFMEVDAPTASAAPGMAERYIIHEYLCGFLNATE